MSNVYTCIYKGVYTCMWNLLSTQMWRFRQTKVLFVWMYVLYMESNACNMYTTIIYISCISVLCTLHTYLYTTSMYEHVHVHVHYCCVFEGEENMEEDDLEAADSGMGASLRPSSSGRLSSLSHYSDGTIIQIPSERSVSS